MQVHTNELELAVITGMKQFWEGEYTPGGGSGIWDNFEPSEPYTSQDKQVVVWCVRLGYRNKELYFFEEDIIDATFDPSHAGKDIPYFWSGGWSKAMREKMSRESKDWPRDKKGRFCK
jgi:hypothetical protein